MSKHSAAVNQAKRQNVSATVLCITIAQSQQNGMPPLSAQGENNENAPTSQGSDRAPAPQDICLLCGQGQDGYVWAKERTMTDRELMQMALDALDAIQTSYRHAVNLQDRSQDDVYTMAAHNAGARLRAALAQPEQEPVAWRRPKYMIEDGWDEFGFTDSSGEDVPLYTAPPQREWVGLTDEEMRKTVDGYFEFDGGDMWGSYRAIEAKLKAKNA